MQLFYSPSLSTLVSLVHKMSYDLCADRCEAAFGKMNSFSIPMLGTLESMWRGLLSPWIYICNRNFKVRLVGPKDFRYQIGVRRGN